MLEPRTTGFKRTRDRYSRLICLGCCDRRIRCELPSNIEIPPTGELRTIHTPCHRCKKLGIPCVIRQTVLGRRNPTVNEVNASNAADLRPATSGGIVSRIVIELPSQVVIGDQPSTTQCDLPLSDSSAVSQAILRSSSDLVPSQEYTALWERESPLIYVPQSAETVLVIRALATLRQENVEEEWFRHLPSRVGHTTALDLSAKALVAACAYGRGVPKLTSGVCYQALALALKALQANIEHSHEKLDDDLLASMALLAPFEGVIKRNGLPTHPHVEGLAAILEARPEAYPVTPLAREILDFFVGESSVMACIKGTVSPFENVAGAYFINDRMGYSDSDQAHLRALSSELFIRIPRLLRLVRLLRLQPAPQRQLLLEALRLSDSLDGLQDHDAEDRLMRKTTIQPSKAPEASSPLWQSLHFASDKDFEALTHYWQTRLSLLTLESHLHGLFNSSNVETGNADESGVCFQPHSRPRAGEMSRLAKNILISLEYARTLKLRKQTRLWAHAIAVVWGVTMDVPVAFARSQAGERTNPFSHLLLRGVNRALRTKPDLTVEDMNTASDIFTGGQPHGRFAELYGL